MMLLDDPPTAEVAILTTMSASSARFTYPLMMIAPPAAGVTITLAVGTVCLRIFRSSS